MTKRWLLICFASVCACGGGDADGNGNGNDVDGAPGGGADAAPGVDAGAPDAPSDPGVADAIEDDVVGTYVTRQAVATMQTVPILGESESTSVAVGLVDIRREGNGFIAVERGCHVAIQGGQSSVTTTIPDAVPRSVPAREVALTFWRDGDAVRWQRAETVTLVGVELANPGSDPLPTMPDAPGVWDQDEDGQPGVTVKLSGFASGDIYVVQRMRASFYDGLLDGPGELTALVEDGSEQSVIGSTNPLLNQNIETTPHPDASRSNVAMVRVQGEYDCDKAVAEADTLFP